MPERAGPNSLKRQRWPLFIRCSALKIPTPTKKVREWCPSRSAGFRPLIFWSAPRSWLREPFAVATVDFRQGAGIERAFTFSALELGSDVCGKFSKEQPSPLGASASELTCNTILHYLDAVSLLGSPLLLPAFGEL